MKEVLNQKLANLSQTPYSKGGEIFMAEQRGENMPQSASNQKPSNPERTEDVSPKQAEPKEMAKTKESGEDVSPENEKRIQEEIAKKGSKVPAGGAQQQPDADIDAAIRRIGTTEFRSILERLRFASSDEVRELYGELKTNYREVFNNIYRQRQALIDQGINPQDRRLTAIDETIARLPQERAEVDRLLVSRIDPRSGRRIDEAEIRLLDEIEELSERIRGTADINIARALITERRDRIKRLMDRLPDPADEPIPDEVLAAIGRDFSTTQEFITRLILPEQEDEMYQMKGFYSAVNRDKFLKVTRLQRLIVGDDRVNLESLMAATETFHNMNYVMKRSFDQFVQQSQLLLPKHFNILSRLSGVRIGLQLYEEYYQKEIGNRTRVSEQELDNIDKKVRAAFEEQVSAAVSTGNRQEKAIKGVYGREMERWEVDRALMYGRDFFRIVRAPEIVSNSELPMKSDPQLFVSSPQKELTQLLHPLKFVIFRFRPNISRGGPEVVETLLERRVKERREKRQVRLKILQGTDVDTRELKDVVAPRMVFATWRNAKAILGQVKFGDGEKVTDVTSFFLENREKISNFSKEVELVNELVGKKRWRDAARIMNFDGNDVEGRVGEWKRERVNTLFGPLIQNNSLALGLLLSGNFLPVPAELKEVIWEKVARLDPLTMSSFLTRMEADREHSAVKKAAEEGRPFEVKSLEEIIMNVWGDRHPGFDVVAAREIKNRIMRLREEKREADNNKNTTEARRLSEEIDRLSKEYDQKDEQLQEVLNDPRWLTLQEKLRLLNEFRIQKEIEKIRGNSLEELNRRSSSSIEEFFDQVNLDANEREVIRQIQESGGKISPDLARMRQVDAWFLNDVPLEIVEWRNLGQFFDRETGDLAQFNQANQALLEWLADPFGTPPEKVMEHFSKAIQSAGNVLGFEASQDRMKGLYEVYLDYIYEYPRYRQKIISSIRHGRHLPTSRAQELAGIHAPSADESSMFDVVSKSLYAKIFRLPGKYKDLDGWEEEWDGNYKEEEKRYKLQWWRRMVWANLRDFGPFFVGALLIQFFKDLLKDISSEK